MSRKMIFGIVMFIVIAIIIVFLISVTINRGGKSNSGKSPSEAAAVKQSISLIVANPITYEGQNVQFDGNMSDWITKRVYTVSDQPTGVLGTGGGLSIIVIASKDYKLTTDPTSTALGLGDLGKVFVQGRVTIMDKQQLSEAIGYDIDGPMIDLDNNGLIKNWEKGTVIILKSIVKE